MRERYLATRQTSHIRNISRSCHHPATDEISRPHEKDFVFEIEYNFVRFSDGFNRSFGVAMHREAWMVKPKASFEKEAFPQTPFQKTFSTAKNADFTIDIFRRDKNLFLKKVLR